MEPRCRLWKEALLPTQWACTSKSFLTLLARNFLVMSMISAALFLLPTALSDVLAPRPSWKLVHILRSHTLAPFPPVAVFSSVWNISSDMCEHIHKRDLTSVPTAVKHSQDLITWRNTSVPMAVKMAEMVP
jgi:hypothetical protein